MYICLFGTQCPGEVLTIVRRSPLERITHQKLIIIAWKSRGLFYAYIFLKTLYVCVCVCVCVCLCVCVYKALLIRKGFEAILH